MTGSRGARGRCRGVVAGAAILALSACDGRGDNTALPRGGGASPTDPPSTGNSAASRDERAPRDAVSIPPREPSLATITPQRDLPDFEPLIGTRDEGFAPRWALRLKRGLTPAEAGKILPGAERVSEFGFAEVRLREPKGLAWVKLYFTDGGKSLASVTMYLEPRLNGPDTWRALRQAAIDKWGPLRKEDPGKHLLLWFDLERGSVTINEGLTEREGYNIAFQFP